MKQAFNLEPTKIQEPPQRTSEFLQPFDVLTCSCCAGQWSREDGGRTVQLGGSLRYLLCNDCIEQEKISAFMAVRGGSKNRFSRPLQRDDIIILLFALREEKRPQW